MLYNLYQFDFDGKLEKKSFQILKDEIRFSIQRIENEIAAEFLRKQESKLGIKNLGNELRYNEILSNEFENLDYDFIIVKMTENKRSFLKVLLTSINKYNKKEIYFWVLKREFGMNSQIVDKTFPDIEDIQGYMDLLRENFFPKSNLSIFLIEMYGFEKFIVTNQNNYSRLVYKN